MFFSFRGERQRNYVKGRQSDGTKLQTEDSYLMIYECIAYTMQDRRRMKEEKNGFLIAAANWNNNIVW